VMTRTPFATCFCHVTCASLHSRAPSRTAHPVPVSVRHAAHGARRRHRSARARRCRPQVRHWAAACGKRVRLPHSVSKAGVLRVCARTAGRLAEPGALCHRPARLADSTGRRALRAAPPRPSRAVGTCRCARYARAAGCSVQA
jgi:hypothetical protein